MKSMTELVPTYYVDYDDHFHLMQIKSVQNSERSSEMTEDDARDYEERYIEEHDNNTRL